MALDIGQLFERYQGVVYRRCVSLLRDDVAAQDAVQEVFVAAITGFGRFRLRASPLTWLYAVATRHCLQRLRNDKAHALKSILLRDDETFDAALDARVELDALLRSLSLEDLELVTLHYRDGLTQEEVADVLRLSRKTVGRRLMALSARVTLGARPDAVTTPAAASRGL